MKKKFKLPNRYGDTVYLKQINNNEYLLQIENNCPVQITYKNNNKNEIMAVDPSGGPMIYRGYVIEKYIVTDIKHDNGFKIILDEM